MLNCVDLRRHISFKENRPLGSEKCIFLWNESKITFVCCNNAPMTNFPWGHGRHQEDPCLDTCVDTNTKSSKSFNLSPHTLLRMSAPKTTLDQLDAFLCFWAIKHPNQIICKHMFDANFANRKDVPGNILSCWKSSWLKNLTLILWAFLAWLP